MSEKGTMYKPVRLKRLRDLAQRLWVKYPFRWLYRFGYACEHTHTFKHFLPKDTLWYFKGERGGTHDGLMLEGCYLCGKIRVRDWKA
jgi:hypothetical protein